MSFDRDLAYSILDEGIVAHVGFVVDGAPFVIPMVYGRVEDRLMLHGSVATRLARTLDAGAPVCVTVTHLDGLVVAKSQFHHSANYRSSVILGNARRLADQEAESALEDIVDHALPGRSLEARPTNRVELRQTMVLAVPIDEASVKMRTGAPIDDEEDQSLEVWSGVLPLRTVVGEPQPDEFTPPDGSLPPSVTAVLQRLAGW